MDDLVNLNASSLSLFPFKKSSMDCQGYFGGMLLLVLILQFSDVCGQGRAEVQAAVLALLQLVMAGVGGLRRAQSCPFPPLVEVSLWIPVSLWGMYAYTAPALHEEGLLSYKSLLFKHSTPFWVVFDIRNFL